LNSLFPAVFGCLSSAPRRLFAHPTIFVFNGFGFPPVPFLLVHQLPSGTQKATWFFPFFYDSSPSFFLFLCDSFPLFSNPMSGHVSWLTFFFPCDFVSILLRFVCTFACPLFFLFNVYRDFLAILAHGHEPCLPLFSCPRGGGGSFPRLFSPAPGFVGSPEKSDYFPLFTLWGDVEFIF